MHTGICTRQKIQASERPSVRPASARFWSKLSKAPRAVRYMRGKATTMVAKTADHQFMVSRMPKVSMTQRPMGRLGPRSTSSSQPTTVGGSTSGSVSTTSSTPLTSRGSFAIYWAEKMPRKKTAAVEIAAMRREFSRGYQSKGVHLTKGGMGARPCWRTPAKIQTIGEKPTASKQASASAVCR